MLEVALGGVTGLMVSFLVLPARAHVLVIDAAADMLGLLARALPDLFSGFTQALDAAEVRRVQNSIGAAFARVDAVGAEAKREQMTYLGAQPDPGPLLRTLLRLRHDLVMIGRAAVPLPERFQVQLGPPLARVVETAADYLRAGRLALIARRNSPPLDEVEAALGCLCRRDRHCAPRTTHAGFAGRRGRTNLHARLRARAAPPEFHRSCALCD